jgi:integrase
VKLTVNATADLKLPAGKRDHIEFDTDIAGFGIRLRDGGGKRAWVFQYKTGSRQRRMTFGTYPAMSVPKARERAAELHAEVKLGGDPAGAKAESQARSGETFEACMRLYLERRRNEGKLRSSSYGEIERHLTRNLKALHSLRIDKVDRRAIALELGRLTTAIGPVQANRTRGSLVKFMNWSAGEGFIDANPATFTNKNPEQPRDRVLVDAELRTIWLALPDGDFGDIIKLLALTGQRKREISDLRWDEVDLDRGIITLPPPRTKNGRWHTIPLSAPAAAILKARTRHADRHLIFGLGHRGFSGWTKAKLQLDEAVKLSAFTIHDLRRAVATGMNEIGVQPHIVEAILNHVSGSKSGVAGRYNRAAYEAEKTTALARWAEHLIAVVEGSESNVAPLKRA